MSEPSSFDQLETLVRTSLSQRVAERPEAIAEWIRNADDTTVQRVLDVLFENVDINEWKAKTAFVSPLLVGLIRREQIQPLSPSALESIGEIHAQLETHAAVQCLLLRLCVAAEQPESYKMFAELLTNGAIYPPRSYVEMFGDLIRRGNQPVSAVFPHLLEGIRSPQLASFVLDYANFALRSGYVTSHPATGELPRLMSLLSSLSERLQQLQDEPPETESETIQRGKQVTESVALAVSLCDALSGIGDDRAVAALNKALGVEHRRLRVEAAAALSRLGVEDAKKLLTAMAAEPAERLRVLAYAEELDLLDEIEDEFCNVVARAEAELVMFLSQPDQMGLPPQHIELVDQCEMAWPGYEEPRNCYLFQFVYQFRNGEFTNIGIAGPVVMTFDADLTFLPREDIYGLFAGWHVDHPEIFAVDAQRTAGNDELQMQRMLRSLTESDEFVDVVPTLFGTLLDRKVMIASATRQDEDGWAIVGEDSVGWLTLGTPERPLGAGEAFYLFVGRSLLRSFN